MEPNQEIINDHIEAIAGLKADVQWLIREKKRADRHRAKIDKKVNFNERLLHGVFIGGGIVMVVLAALSPILTPIILEAIK